MIAGEHLRSRPLAQEHGKDKRCELVEAGGSEYSGVLKTRNLLIFRDAQNVENGEIAPNWNVSGTRLAKKRSVAAAKS
jgi:hypothetical protein